MDKIKLSYLQCERGPEHRYEPLNYVCIDPSSSYKGLICSICKSGEHKSHEVIPLKLLLNHLQGMKGMADMNGLETCLESVEQHRNLVLCQLKTAVESLAKMFQTMEQQICDQFARVKTSLLEEVEVNLNLSSFVQKTMQNIIQSRQQYLSNFSQLANMVKYNSETKKIKLQPKIFQKTKIYEQKQVNFSQMLEGLEEYVTNYFKIKDNNKQTKNKNSLKKVKGLFDDSSEEDFALGDYFDDGMPTSFSAKIPKIKEGYTFSAINKSSSIKITDQSLRAKQSVSGQERFAFVQQNIGAKNQTIAFEIVNLTNWVGVGIGILDILKKAKYHFNYNQNNHGSFLVSSNSYSWSHNNGEENIKNIPFSKFNKGDIIDVNLGTEVIRFRNRRSKQTQSLKVNLSANQWKSVCFCVNLCTANDEVKIVQYKSF